MGNGWHEWPLVIFTVLGQCVVGALIVSGIGWFAAKITLQRVRKPHLWLRYSPVTAGKLSGLYQKRH